MTSLRTELCYRLSRRLTKPPESVETDPVHYGNWREEELRKSYSRFGNTDFNGKHILDFGCGEGQLALILARNEKPGSIVGIDIDDKAIARAKRALATEANSALACPVEFRLGDSDRMPVAQESFDTVVAFDCLEHVMEPEAILREWYRALRPGGKVLIEWFPFKGPFGPHMSSLVPIPWAHILFGERALFETAERIYEEPGYVPRKWDLDENGDKKPNKWSQWRSFTEQGYLNKLTIGEFRKMVARVGFRIVRQDDRGFGEAGAKKAIGNMLMNLPLLDSYCVNFTMIELQK